MKLVFISSPYGGDHMNVEVAREYMRYAAAMGQTPIAPHVMLHDVMDDNDPEQRARAMAACIDLLDLCGAMWVCGSQITPGMKREIDHAKKMLYSIRYVKDSEVEAFLYLGKRK